MEQKTLSAATRTALKKGATHLLRRQGKIPAVVYGNMETTPVTIDEQEFAVKFRTVSENMIIDLKIDGVSRDVLVKDYQEDLRRGKILHIDFYAIDKDKLLRSRVPVRLTGSAKGARDGGIVEQQIHEIDVECKPHDLPAEFLVDITSLESGRGVHVRDIPVPAGVRILSSPDQAVVSITHVKAEAAPVAEEAAAAAETEAAAAAPGAAGAAGAAPAPGGAAPAAGAAKKGG
ncbi:MAG: 50S ribosomal protein L25 [Spirochaetaceae bacterium]|nr:50S ribosomal protein L25 [Spirochaetaceae bacterium]